MAVDAAKSLSRTPYLKSDKTPALWVPSFGTA